MERNAEGQLKDTEHGQQLDREIIKALPDELCARRWLPSSMTLRWARRGRARSSSGGATGQQQRWRDRPGRTEEGARRRRRAEVLSERLQALREGALLEATPRRRVQLARDLRELLRAT